METVKWLYIINYIPGELKSNHIYNLLVQRAGYVEDVRCRVISSNSTSVLIFKLKNE